MLRSDIHYYARGSIIAENHETAYALMVITSGLVGPSSRIGSSVDI